MLTRPPVPVTSSSSLSGFPSLHYAPASCSPRLSPEIRGPVPPPKGPGFTSSTIQSRSGDPFTSRGSPIAQPKSHRVVDADREQTPEELFDSHHVGAPSESSSLPAPKPTVMSGVDSATSPPTQPATEIEAIPVAQHSTPATSQDIPSSSSAAKETDGSDQASPSRKRQNSQGLGKEAEGRTSPAMEDAPVRKVPGSYELCGVQDLVVLIAHMLNELIERNDWIAMQSGNLTRFHSRYDRSSSSITSRSLPI
jgi:hypothetical protein